MWNPTGNKEQALFDQIQISDPVPGLINRLLENDVGSLTYSHGCKKKRKNLQTEEKKQDGDEENDWPEVAVAPLSPPSSSAPHENNKDKEDRYVGYLLGQNPGDHDMYAPMLEGPAMSNDLLRVLTRAMRRNVSLTEVNLSDNDMSSEGAMRVGDVLRSNATIQYLNLSHNKIGATGMAGLIFGGLRVNEGSRLHTLELGNNRFFNEGACIIAQWLRTNNTLVKLDLSSDDIYAEGAMAVFDALGENRTLTQLQFARNLSLYEGAQVLANSLKKNNTLIRLDITANLVFADGTAEIAAALMENTTLQELHMGENEIGDLGVKSLVTALKHNSTLSVLHLSDNLVGVLGLKALPSALGAKQQTLRVLNLSRNLLGSQRKLGLPSLCEVLKKNTSLEHLNLSQNELDVESVTLICTALQKNKTLKELDLASNRFECEGVTPLTDLLPHASSKQKSESQLQSLRLSHNRIQDAGAIELATCLQTNTTLTSLDLRFNRLYEQAERVFVVMMFHNHTLRECDISHNRFVVQPPSPQRAKKRESVVLPTPTEELQAYLSRNRREHRRKIQTAFLLALHPIAGQESAVFQTFKASPIGDTHVFLHVWNALFGKREEILCDGVKLE